MRQRKYRTENLVPMFILAARVRNEMIAANFTDNGGAIHSAERILDILGLHLNYPELTHRNSLKRIEKAECSKAAFKARSRKEKVLVEHVAPLRALTQGAIAGIQNLDGKEAEECLVAFVKAHYRLVLLTPDETLALNKRNRSRIEEDRLAGIELHRHE